ncbi:hypothetical protein MtrunA17_Chr2g0331061 [Medicago truncatula]|uniref:Uncharacterized protein n=1 Tax=Medicago truncatula TaxID=3880 RepID=A0A396JMT9_MEDTR|nr:hypothetical protein MtrunA17_Chr2g0331061 [Medicago truncatula]
MLVNGGNIKPFSKFSSDTCSANASAAARSRSSCTRMVPDIIKPRPNPGNMYALFA